MVLGWRYSSNKKWGWGEPSMTTSSLHASPFLAWECQAQASGKARAALSTPMAWLS